MDMHSVICMMAFYRSINFSKLYRGLLLIMLTFRLFALFALKLSIVSFETTVLASDPSIKSTYVIYLSLLWLAIKVFVVCGRFRILTYLLTSTNSQLPLKCYTGSALLHYINLISQWDRI